MHCTALHFQGDRGCLCSHQPKYHPGQKKNPVWLFWGGATLLNFWMFWSEDSSWVVATWIYPGSAVPDSLITGVYSDIALIRFFLLIAAPVFEAPGVPFTTGATHVIWFTRFRPEWCLRTWGDHSWGDEVFWVGCVLKWHHYFMYFHPLGNQTAWGCWPQSFFV